MGNLSEVKLETEFDFVNYLRKASEGDFNLQDLPLNLASWVREMFHDISEQSLERYDILRTVMYDIPPVSITEFLTNKDYLGFLNLYDAWFPEVEHVLSPSSMVHEWVMTGAIGTGKTFVAVIVQMYKMYLLMCMKDPQGFYKLSPGSPFVFGLFNITKQLADSTSYRYLKNWMTLSPFFSEALTKSAAKKTLIGLPKSVTRQYIELPNFVTIALGADAIHALGQNVFGGLMDEADFGRSNSLTSDDKSQVEALYESVKERIQSRFMQADGRIPGLLCIVTSARDQSDFAEKHIEKHLDDSSVFVTRFSQWDVKPEWMDASRRRGDSFWIVVGDATTRSQILDQPPDTLNEGARLHEIPGIYRKDFDLYMEDSIRNKLGVSTYGTSTLIPQRDLINQCMAQATERDNPFRTVPSSRDPEVSVIHLGVDHKSTVEDYFDLHKVCRLVDPGRKLYTPLYYPHMSRFIHVDLAKNYSRAGVVMGGLKAVKPVQKFDQHGNTYQADELHYWIDLMVGIEAYKGDEIDLEKVRDFVYYLRETCGFNILLVSYDQYQSTQSMQGLRKSGFNTKEQSVVKKLGPYMLLRSAVLEMRLDAPYYDLFVKELATVQRIRVRTREIIDKPLHGSKDCTDSAAAVVHLATETKETGAFYGDDYLIVGELSEPENNEMHEINLGKPPRRGDDLNKLFED